MSTLFSHILLLVCICVLSACGGGDAPSRERLPHVLAPVDTLGRAGDSVATQGRGDEPLAASGDRWQVEAPYANWPRADRLTFTRYDNPAFGFSIAIPDTVLRPSGDIGEGRGRAFGTFDGQAVALVYAVEDAGLQALDAQYQQYLDEPGVRITYRVREDDWYVLAGYRGDRKFYDKTILRGGILKTFQIQYDTARASYYDVVTAAMAASFEG